MVNIKGDRRFSRKRNRRIGRFRKSKKSRNIKRLRKYKKSKKSLKRKSYMYKKGGSKLEVDSVKKTIENDLVLTCSMKTYDELLDDYVSLRETKSKKLIKLFGFIGNIVSGTTSAITSFGTDFSAIVKVSEGAYSVYKGSEEITKLTKGQKRDDFLNFILCITSKIRVYLDDLDDILYKIDGANTFYGLGKTNIALLLEKILAFNIYDGATSEKVEELEYGDLEKVILGTYYCEIKLSKFHLSNTRKGAALKDRAAVVAGKETDINDNHVNSIMKGVLTSIYSKLYNMQNLGDSSFLEQLRIPAEKLYSKSCNSNPSQRDETSNTTSIVCNREVNKRLLSFIINSIITCSRQYELLNIPDDKEKEEEKEENITKIKQNIFLINPKKTAGVAPYKDYSQSGPENPEKYGTLQFMNKNCKMFESIQKEHTPSPNVKTYINIKTITKLDTTSNDIDTIINNGGFINSNLHQAEVKLALEALPEAERPPMNLFMKNVTNDVGQAAFTPTVKVPRVTETTSL